MRFSQEKLEELAEQIDIVDLVGRTEELHQKGQNYFIKCPFHSGDDTPSLCIYPETNRWYCFGCGAGSSVYDWIMKKEGITFPEAFEKVCNMVGEEPTEYTESESIAFLKQLKKQKNNKDISVNLRKTLDFAEDYLNKYSEELPEEWLTEDMTEEALKTYYIRVDHNANRIVYPVFDADNNFIGVKGRTRIKAYKELGLSKYMNYYKIGTIDYFQGVQQAEFGIPKTVIIFEGIKSCIKAWGWNIKNTMASETSSLSEGQLKFLIKNNFNEIIIGWDIDQDFKKIATNDKIQMLKKFTKVSVIKDSNHLLDTKMAPVDKGEAIFRKLLSERVRI